MKKLLAIIDYQKDFVDGALGFSKAESLEEGIYNKVKEYLNNNQKVLFTYDTHYNNYLDTREGKNLPVKHCIIDTDGHKLYGKLGEFEKEKDIIYLNKESFGIAPEDLIRLKNEFVELDQIEIIGVVTNMCVISSVVNFQSTFTNAEIVVNSKLCASFDDELHQKALDVIEGLQAKVI